MVGIFVVGMVLGAIIAIVATGIGYFYGGKESLLGDKETIYSPVNVVNEEYERECLKVVKDETENRKTASNLFRTKKGLLSYKKFVRE